MNTETNNRVSIVTGSSRGIGRAIVLTLAQRGHHVVINCRSNLEAAKAVAAEVESAGGAALVVQADVSRETEAKRLVEETMQRFSRIDVLVNNAGILQDNFLSFMTEEQWDSVMDINLKGAFLCTKFASKQMVKQKWGRVINISSDAGLMGDMMRTNYSAAKAGLIGFTKAAARELATRGITVNAVAPGYIETDMTGDLPEGKREQLVARIPLSRLGSPYEVALAVAFLTSEQSGYITGQVLSVDGGLHV